MNLQYSDELSFQIQDIDNRMKKIEGVIQDIQRAVIKKMGEYGDAISNISGEIRATQQSFAKVINPLLDKQRGIKSQSENYEEAQESSAQQSQQKQKGQSQQNQQQQQQGRPRPNGKNSATFEDYFR